MDENELVLDTARFISDIDARNAVRYPDVYAQQLQELGELTVSAVHVKVESGLIKTETARIEGDIACGDVTYEAQIGLTFFGPLSWTNIVSKIRGKKTPVGLSIIATGGDPAKWLKEPARLTNMK